MYGDLFQAIRYDGMDNTYYIMSQTPVPSQWAVKCETIGQFTGLTDKNGTKIFDGDILKFYNGEEFTYYEVIWFGTGFKILMVDETEIQGNLDLIFCEHSEVIGNIHDNPELLEAV